MNLNVYKDLIDCALNSQNKAYTPYSQFKVGLQQCVRKEWLYLKLFLMEK